MGTTLKGVKSLDGEVGLHQYSLGRGNGRAIQITPASDGVLNLRTIKLTEDQALELAQALIEFVRYKREAASQHITIEHESAEGKYNPNAWERANTAKVGQEINCPSCGRPMKKKSYQHKFCNTRCKDDYWNDKPSRRERASELGHCHSREEIEEMEEMAYEPHPFSSEALGQD